MDLQNFPCPETDEEVKEFTELCRKLKVTLVIAFSPSVMNGTRTNHTGAAL